MKPFTRRLFLVGAVLAALVMLIAPPLAGADDDDGGGGGGDRAFCAPAGSLDPGQCSTITGNRFDFEASSGPLGENPGGTWRLEDDGFFYEAEITCLQVTGNRASLGGRVTDSSNPDLVGLGFAISVLDNTPVGPDLISTGGFLPEAPPANTFRCGDPVEPAVPVVDGDIVVQDNIAGGGGGEDDDDGEDDEDEDDEDDDD